MRLISQDGMVDVPYEYGSLCQGFIKGEEHLIYTISYYNYSSQKGTRLAEYSSKAKALKVMELLREQYQRLEVAKVIGCGSAERISKDATQTVADIIISEFEKAVTFSFPKDEDVEM